MLWWVVWLLLLGLGCVFCGLVVYVCGWVFLCLFVFVLMGVLGCYGGAYDGFDLCYYIVCWLLVGCVLFLLLIRFGGFCCFDWLVVVFGVLRLVWWYLLFLFSCFGLVWFVVMFRCVCVGLFSV